MRPAIYASVMWCARIPMYVAQTTVFCSEVGACFDHSEITIGDPFICAALCVRVSLPLACSCSLWLPTILLNVRSAPHG